MVSQAMMHHAVTLVRGLTILNGMHLDFFCQ